MSDETKFHASPPAKLMGRMEEAGAARAALRVDALLGLAVLAGAFVGLGAAFATAVMPGLPVGLARLLGGLAFCLGPLAVVLTGTELFMGNHLMVMAFAAGRIRLPRVLGRWAVVLLGNAAGALLVAVAMFLGGQFLLSKGALGASALEMAASRSALGFGQALILGILGSAAIGLAMWLAFSARSLAGKVVSILLPVTAFVAAGLEHAVPDLYWVPFGLLVRDLVPADSAFWASVGKTAADLPDLTWANYLLNSLLPVTIGNLVGGAGLVGLAYWFLFLRPTKVVQVKKQKRVPQILVVDDDPDFVEVTTMILEKEGFQFSTAYNGREAWDAMKAKKPDMVLLDVMMSTTLEGVDLARRMAADARLKDVPIIMISSIDSTYHAGKLPDSIHIPIDAWLSKPVNPEVLLRTVRRFLA